MQPPMLPRALTLTTWEWLYLVIAARELALARLRFARFSAGEIVSDLQECHLNQKQQDLPSSWPISLERVAWAIAAAAARVPWRADCLLQAMAAERWLRRHGLAPHFFIGFNKDDAGQLNAHAWLRCNDVCITGGPGDNYVTLIRSKPSQTDIDA